MIMVGLYRRVRTVAPRYRFSYERAVAGVRNSILGGFRGDGYTSAVPHSGAKSFGSPITRLKSTYEFEGIWKSTKKLVAVRFPLVMNWLFPWRWLCPALPES